MVAFTLLMSLRLALDPLARSWLILGVFASTVLFAVAVCVVVFRVFNRKIDRLAALAGPGGWGAECVDPDDRQRFRALLVDDEGIRVVGLSGDVQRHWGWRNIRDVVTVGRFPVALTTSVGVVLYLDDGSVAQLLLPSRAHMTYPRPRAEAAAKDIRARLSAFRAGALPRAGHQPGPASDSHGRPLRVNHSDGP